MAINIQSVALMQLYTLESVKHGQFWFKGSTLAKMILVTKLCTSEAVNEL